MIIRTNSRRRDEDRVMTSPIYLEDRSEVDDPKPIVRDEEPMEDLPHRVERLEGEIAALRETLGRFGELIVGELKRLQPVLPPSPTTTPETDTRMIPVATDQTMQYLQSLWDKNDTTKKSGWLLIDLFRDFSATFRMYLDPRYRIRRSTQIFVPCVLGLFVLNYFFSALFPIPVLDKVLEKIVDIVLAILLYKVVLRELVRYREVIAHFGKDVPPRNSVIIGDGEPPHTNMDIER